MASKDSFAAPVCHDHELGSEIAYFFFMLLCIDNFMHYCFTVVVGKLLFSFSRTEQICIYMCAPPAPTLSNLLRRLKKQI